MRFNMRILIKVIVGLALLAPAAAVQAVDRLFVLTAENQIVYYRTDDAHNTKLVRTYGKNDLPGAFPARFLEIGRGNILTTYDSHRNRVGRFVFDSQLEQLVPYVGDPAGRRTELGGRILEQPELDEPFRGEGSFYAKSGKTFWEMELNRLEERTGKHFLDLVVLDGQVLGLKPETIERVAAESRSTGTTALEPLLRSPGSRFRRGVVSPWQELFVSDGSRPTIRRFRFKEGQLVGGIDISDKDWGSLADLEFSEDGDLFVATGMQGGRQEILRYGFVLENFVNWRPVLRERIPIQGTNLLDLALTRPVGYVLSEKTHPLVKLSAAQAGGHFGISQSVLVSPQTNSEASVIALVEYEPGGYTPVHSHPQFEQVEIVVSGRALWEVGETEREVSAGDVIFCPRNVKHGYKVLGNQPFKFLQIEWREWKIDK